MKFLFHVLHFLSLTSGLQAPTGNNLIVADMPKQRPKNSLHVLKQVNKPKTFLQKIQLASAERQCFSANQRA